MQEEREKAEELLKSGKYYDEARKWYNSRYITPRSQLAHMSVFVFIAAIALLVTMVSTAKIFPLADTESFTINRELKFNEGITIDEIGEPRDDATIAFLEYMLKKYVVAREEYNPKNINYNFNFVIEQTSEDIFMEYLETADKNQNPNHPVWQYGSQAIKDVYPTKVAFPELGSSLENYEAGKSYVAKVSFVSTLQFIDSAQKQQKNIADITFTFKAIEIDQDTAEIKQLPKMVVTDYKSRKL